MAKFTELPEKSLNRNEMEALLRKVLPWVEGTFVANYPTDNEHSVGHMVATCLLLSHGWRQDEFCQGDGMRLCRLIEGEESNGNISR